MNFLNLGLGELLGVAGAISAGVVALYLLDRSKRRQVVATLRFWQPADVRTELKHRRRIQQPWSLALQLASLALLLTAIAGPQFGVLDGLGRDHVLILDTSAWMGAVTGRGTLLDQAKASALAYVRALPRRDRVMIVRADALATPATAFESDRAIAEAAILESQPSASALRLAQAVEFAQRVQRMRSERAGEIALVGAARVSPEDEALAAPSNLRYIAVEAALENVGLRRLGLRRSPAAPDRWEIFAAVHNYGRRTQVVDLSVEFALSPVGNRRMTLRPGSEEEATFVYPEKAAGYVEARLNTRDAVPQDDRAVVEAPRQAAIKMIVYSNEPQALRPLFTTNPFVEAEFRAPEAFDAAAQADIVVLDRFAPPAPPRSHAIWIAPPASGSPVPIRATFRRVALERWSTETPLGAGLYTRDVTLESAAVFAPAAGDIPVAAVAAGPVVVAREGAVKQMLIGFHPGRPSMRFELAAPLLIANTLRWMAPASYRRIELEAGRVGSVNLAVGKDVQAADVQVIGEADQRLPFTIEDGVLRFFSGKPGTVRVRMGDRETVYSLTLPDLAEASWKAPEKLARGVPEAPAAGAAPNELWPWLALAGAAGWLADWLLFGRSRALRLRAVKAGAALPGVWRKAS